MIVPRLNGSGNVRRVVERSWFLQRTSGSGRLVGDLCPNGLWNAEGGKRRLGPTEKNALEQTTTQFVHHGAFLHGLDSFRNHADSLAFRIFQNVSNQTGTAAVAADVVE